VRRDRDVPEFEKRLRQTKIDVDLTLRNAVLGQIKATREEYSRSHGKVKESKKIELEAALRKLWELETNKLSPKVLPFSYSYFFADVMSSGGFDVVLMNPPYIRQEHIGKLPGQDENLYKSQIASDVELVTNNQFRPSGQSDISLYFHIRSLSLLRDEGVAVVIASAKWLDVGYGVPLQEYLLNHAAIDCIFDSVDRSFSADVNTIISVIRKATTNVANNQVRFVLFKIPFRDIVGKDIEEIITTQASNGHKIAFKDKYRLTVKTQEELYIEGLEEGSNEDVENEDETPKKEYVGTKWGNLHLRAPLVYYQILAQGKGKFKRLGNLYQIKRGEKTANADFFILRKTEGEKRRGLIRCENGLGHKLYLEEEFAPPVLSDPEDVSTFLLKERDVSTRIFRCRERRNKLKGTYAMKYIEWAETSPDSKVKVLKGKERGKMVRVSQLATVRGKGSEWYQVSAAEPSRILLPNLVKNRHVIAMGDVPLYAYHNFLYLYGDKVDDLWLYLNSALFRLFMELNGRSEGAGALQIMSYEYKQCPIIYRLPTLSRNFSGIRQFESREAHRIVNIAEKGPLELEQHDRRELDELILEAIGFVEKTERESVLNGIYSWLRERVEGRLLKPKTGPESIAKAVGKKRVQTDLREFQ
jgi:hypothetical protein